MRTPNNITKHELIGLHVEVVEAKNSDLVGIKGKVVDETKHTVILATVNGERKVLKKGMKMKTEVKGQQIIIDGDVLLVRPEDRIKK
tara:strand:- start:6154 stop:6414 length:261 start_codon:yes stop_codon:yes gene_type:complete